VSESADDKLFWLTFQMGYGARALESLNSFYSGELYNFDDAPADLGESFADAAHVAPVGSATSLLSLR
jgi:hypothetical protein